MSNRGRYSTWGVESGRVDLGREHNSASPTAILNNIRAVQALKFGSWYSKVLAVKEIFPAFYFVW